MIGCAALLGIVAIAFGAAAAIASGDSPALGGGMTGGITFVAALLLFARDRGRYRSAVRDVRQNLLTRGDITDAEFTDCFSQTDSTLLLQTRQAIARFFDVADGKIHPSDNLWDDFQFKTLEAELHSFVVYRVFEVRDVNAQPFCFNTKDLVSIADFADEIQRVLDGFDGAAENQDSNIDSQG